MEKLRIDKWLWAARFYKTRSLATEEIDKGRVRVNDLEVKPAKEVKVGDTVELRQGPAIRTLVVSSISDKRGGAPQAQLMYEETEASLSLRAQLTQQRRLEPASSLEHGRPTKRDRRSLDKLGKGNTTSWGSRWSASAD
jgi:ribosome-associated heat shock protein Hsp15